MFQLVKYVNHQSDYKNCCNLPYWEEVFYVILPWKACPTGWIRSRKKRWTLRHFVARDLPEGQSWWA